MSHHPCDRASRALRVGAVLALLIAMAAAGLAATAPAAGQGYATPTIVVRAYGCPDDIAIGDDLSQRCDDPRSDIDISADGPASVNATTDADGRAELTGLERGTYTVTDGSAPDDTVALVSCVAAEGFGGFVNLPVTAGDVPGSFSVDLTNQNAKVGTSDSCLSFLLPAGAFDGPVAGLTFAAGVTDNAALLGLAVTPADGTRTLLSGAGPVLPGASPVPFTVEGDDLDATVSVETAAPGASSASIWDQAAGPVLIPAGDYTVADEASGESVDLTLGDGEVSEVLAVGAEPPGDPSAQPSDAHGDASLAFTGDELAGAWTALDTALYGDEAAAIYGPGSGSSVGTLTFAAPAGTGDAATIAVLGLDDELPAAVPITVTLNGAVLYQGDSAFPDWDPDATGNQWGSMTFNVPAGTLQPSGNALTVTNDSPSGRVGTPPWVMVVAITVSQ